MNESPTVFYKETPVQNEPMIAVAFHFLDTAAQNEPMIADAYTIFYRHQVKVNQ